MVELIIHSWRVINEHCTDANKKNVHFSVSLSCMFASRVLLVLSSEALFWKYLRGDYHWSKYLCGAVGCVSMELGGAKP